MSRFIVTLTRTTIQSAAIEIEAATEEAAIDKATLEANRQIDGSESFIPRIDWELENDEAEVDDINPEDPPEDE